MVWILIIKWVFCKIYYVCLLNDKFVFIIKVDVIELKICCYVMYMKGCICGMYWFICYYLFMVFCMVKIKSCVVIRDINIKYLGRRLFCSFNVCIVVINFYINKNIIISVIIRKNGYIVDRFNWCFDGIVVNYF